MEMRWLKKQEIFAVWRTDHRVFMQLAKNIITFTILFDGVPMIYQGQEQHFDGPGTPQNREALWTSGYNTDAELYKLITKLNRIRKHIIRLDATYVDAQTHSIYQGSSEIAFTKGVEGRQMVMLLSSQGTKSKPYTVTLPVGYNAGTSVMEVMTCKKYLVNNYGELTVDMDAGEPRVFFPVPLMNGSSLCGYPLSNISYTELRTWSSSAGATFALRQPLTRVMGPVVFVIVITTLTLL